MRILHVATFPFPSPQGSQVYVKGILEGLRDRGHTVSLLCYAHGVGEPPEGIRIIRTPQIPLYHNMRAGPDWVKPLLDALMIPLLTAERPDIIHVHNYEAPLVARLAEILRGYPIPLVYSAHNTMEEELPSYFLGRKRKQMAKYIGRGLDRFVPKLSKHCVALSEVGQKKLSSLGCSNVSLVPPGVNPSEFDRVEPKFLPSGRWVVYAGNPDGYQDLDILMRAMTFLPDIGLVMVSASDTRNWEREDGGALLHVQTQDFSEVCGYLRAAHVAVLPRVQCSGFPIKILNYLAMGVPVVCSEGSKIEAPSVLSVPNYDPQAMAACILDLFSDENRRVSLGEQGKKFVFESFSWDVQAEKLEQIYRKLLCA